MAVRYCPNCFKNVVTLPPTPKCSECGRKHTLPVDKSLPIPDERGKHDRYIEGRQYRED
jgi:hypothetical protein